jgi:hypothetical protein
MEIGIEFRELFMRPPKQGACMETREVLPPSDGVFEVLLDVVE